MIFSKFFFVHVAHGRGSVLLQLDDEIPRILGVFFPIDNALYSIAFNTHTKTAEPVEMPFGMISELDPRNNMLRGGDDPRRARGNLGENVPDKPDTPLNYELY